MAPTSVAFPDHKVGSTSASVAVTLTKDCTGAESTNCLPISSGTEGPTFSPSINVTAPFKQTNNCPAALGAGPDTTRSCTIDVTFAPTAVGSSEGALTTGPGGPGVALTGKGTPPGSGGKKCKKNSAAAAKKKKCKKKGRK